VNKYISQAPVDLVQINQGINLGIEKVLGIRIIAIGPDFICGEMPVDERTRQPFGILHGGASIVLAETLGSWASYMIASDDPEARVAGIEVSGSHVRSPSHVLSDWGAASIFGALISTTRKTTCVVQPS
jgi:1,4-dihydroxy-2-naphthoyl-CoA hydrolase